ncbi:hypothetical protein BJ684DRAFT_6253, partial [Piptocephalis cylindrospora]
TSSTTRSLIRRYHTLTKQMGQTQDPEEKARLRKEQEDLGGLEAYQRASALGASKERGGDTSRWLVRQLLQRGCKDQVKALGRPLRLLDIGALSADNYARESSWINVMAMDLNSRDPRILQGDFLQWPAPISPEETFDVVCLSLVVNFLGDPIQRGNMLLRVREFLRPPSRKIPSSPPPSLFLVLPRPCVDHSRYMTEEHLLALGEACGFSQVTTHLSNKLAYSLWHWSGAHPQPSCPRQILRSEGGLNNFSIALSPSSR